MLTFQFSNPYFSVNYRNEYPANSSGLTYATSPFFPITVAKNEPVDFRVRAAIGDLYYISMGVLLFNGNYSYWNQLTITMANGQTSSGSMPPNPTPTSSPAPSPTVPEFTSWILLFLLAVMVSSSLSVYHKKHKH
jgi:hypothetical protein